MTTGQTTVTDEDSATEDPTPVRWWRRRRWQTIVVVGATALAAAGAFAFDREGGEDLPRTSPRQMYGLYDKEPGDTEFALGNVLIFAPGKTVQILEAKALFSANVEYLGAYTVWPRNAVAPPSVAEEFPYAEQKVRHQLTEPIPAAETAVYDTESAQPVPIAVTLGFRILSGMGGVNGIHITYKVNGKTKRQYFPESAYGCVRPLKCEDDDSLSKDDKALRELGLVRED